MAFLVHKCSSTSIIINFLCRTENLENGVGSDQVRRAACQGGEVEMKSCFQSTDKQGESGGKGGRGKSAKVHRSKVHKARARALFVFQCFKPVEGK